MLRSLIVPGVVLVALTAAATPARADRELDVSASAPFSAAELQAAIDARSALPMPPIAVRARVPGVVVISVGGVERIVPTGDQRGEDAARLVALHIVDLVGPPRPTLDGARLSAGGWRLRASAGGGRGLARLNPVLVNTAVDAERLFGRWQVGAGASWLHAPVQDTGTMREVAFDALLLRARVGLAFGPLEIAAGPNAGTFRVAAHREAGGALLGAGAEVRGVWRLTERWRLVAATALDVFRHRVIVSANGEPYATTPYVSLAATLGLAWESGR